MAILSSRRRRTATVVALVFALAAFPLGTAAIHQFTDVPNSNIFHADIDALVDNGVTSGCGGGQYCPSAFVTREQMAAFLNRLGALAPEKTPVVNATTVDRFNASELNRVAFNNEVVVPLVDGNTASSGFLSATITTPTRGYILAWGHANIGNASGAVNDNVYCDLKLDDVTIAGSETWQDATFATSGDEQDCDPSGAAVVCAGGTYTVKLYVGDVATDTNIYYASVMAEFVPFGGTGFQPLCVT